MNRVVHFEIQADDVERAKKFYLEALDWKIERWMKKEETGMDHWGVMTGDGPGINGGLYQRPTEAKEKIFFYDCTVEVEDIDRAVEAVKRAGGQIAKDKSMIPGVGWFAGAIDTEGNRFGLMQTDKGRQ